MGVSVAAVKTFFKLLFGLILALSCALAFMLWREGSLSRELAEKPEPGTVKSREKPAAPAALIAVVIDDLGCARGGVEKYTELGVPVTFAILPCERFSESEALAVKA